MVNLWHMFQWWHTMMFWVTHQHSPTPDNSYSLCLSCQRNWTKINTRTMQPCTTQTLKCILTIPIRTLCFLHICDWRWHERDSSLQNVIGIWQLYSSVVFQPLHRVVVCTAKLIFKEHMQKTTVITVGTLSVIEWNQLLHLCAQVHLIINKYVQICFSFVWCVCMTYASSQVRHLWIFGIRFTNTGLLYTLYTVYYILDVVLI